jgi:zinc transport system substrate-binding protein
VAAVLGELDPANRDLYRRNAETVLKSVRERGRELKQRLEAEGTSQVKVIAMEQQLGFVKWAGFDVVATYPRLADLTPEKVKALMDKGREAGVALVIDNLQTGPEAGVQMAQEIGAVQVTLSNFCGGFEDTETWEKAAERNVELVLAALKEHRGR